MEISNFDGVFDDGRLMKMIPACVEQFSRLLYGVQILAKAHHQNAQKRLPEAHHMTA